jgi:hypothetical protein
MMLKIAMPQVLQIQFSMRARNKGCHGVGILLQIIARFTGCRILV